MAGDSGDCVGDERTIPFDSLPIPVTSYSIRDGSPVLERANRAFESAFGECEPQTSLREWWHSTNTTSEDVSVEELFSTLATGDQLDVRVTCGSGATGDGGRTYRLRSRTEPASNPGDGYLVFTELGSNSDCAVEVDRIASVISHELRNPLDVAKAHLQAARERGDEEHFDRLADAHDRMEQIIKDVLTLARKEDAIAPSPGIELESVVTDAWATVDTANASLALDEELPTIEADRDRLQRLFENLFRNSVEHARPTGSTADEDGDSQPDAGIQVRVGQTPDCGFFVSDNGVGIPLAERDRAFEPGYSSDESGVGLGLAIVEQIAEAHGWTVSLESGASGGARFEFRGFETDR